MEIRKFEKHIYEEEETWLFVKDGDKQVEIYLYTDNDWMYTGKVVENGVKTVGGWNEAVRVYHTFSGSEAEPERSYYGSDDDDDGDEEEFDAIIEASRDWLYS